jgi:glutamate/tyrosine decarboxylase-like PLP-dependent enzyme
MWKKRNKRMIHDKLFKDIQKRELFNKVNNYGFQYLKNVFLRNVYPVKKAIKNLDAFKEALQDEYVSPEDVIDKLETYGNPATVAQVGGRYFGFVNGSIVPAGLAARLMSDYWDQNTGLHVISPVSSVLESVVQSWLRDLFNLPEKTVAGFVSGTSMATFCGLAAARYRILKNNEWDINEKGLFGAPKIRIVTGKQAHSSVLKAINLLGFGKNNVDWIDVDSQGRIKPDQIPGLDKNTIMILQAGNVNTGAFEDFNLLCDKANETGAWIHIDGAFGLWAQAVGELKHLTAGMEKADSWSVDSHKTLNVPYDNGIILCSDEEALVSALHMSGAYIVLSEERDGMFYTPEMSRRARIIELWATMKSLGKKGIVEMVYGLHLRAKQFKEQLEANGFEIVNEVVFNQVLVHYRDNHTTKKILNDIQEQRICWCGGSKWNGKDVIRISVCSWATTESDVSMSVESFIKARENVTNH